MRPQTFVLVFSCLALMSCGRSQMQGVTDEVALETACANGLDDDVDGLVDCLDPDCSNDGDCVVGAENCGNRLDDDGDKLVDCLDPDCRDHRLCRPTGPEICDNQRDDDGDGLADCRDPDCLRWPGCGPRVEQCGNGIDDDGDGLVDCQDPECAGRPSCRVPERCQNGLDDDGDKLVDCFDPDCSDSPLCRGVERCQNGRDDDGDGHVDCADKDCVGHPACGSLQEICDNKRDDDLDGRIDCEDPDCARDPRCRRPEICDNRVDDDADNLIDCADSDCFGHPICAGREICGNGIDDDGDGRIDCADADCLFDPSCGRFEDCQNGRDDDGDGLVDCADGDCLGHPRCQGKEDCTNRRDDDNDTLIDCDDPDCFAHPACDIPGQENCENGRDDDRDNLIDCADPDCAGHPGCGPTKEICHNLRDDDGDNAIDCDDSDCRADPLCANKENCTNKRDDDGDRLVDCDDPDCFKDPSCKTPGKEVCNNGVDDDDDGKVDCDDDDCSSLPICRPGKELCENGRDDDGDGAIDCDDPDCAKDPNCQSLLCRPAVDFGTIAKRGANVTRKVDTRGRPDQYDSRCSVPGGGEVVSRFRLTQTTDVKLSYKQLSGDHMFSLFRAGVGEACNANQRGCFDPDSAKTGSFSLKALPAGEYYLFVEAFAQRLEGEVEVTLSTETGPTAENCSNGVDDDQDGAVDCADLDCVFTPVCENQNCDYDINVGTLVINGPAKRLSITTRGGGDDVAERCAAGGGGDIVIRLVMPAAGGIDLSVAQGGWHVFGLHRDKGPGTRCTADTGGCFDSNATPAFVLEYGSVEKGVYYLVVDALDAKNEGELTLSLRAFKPRGPELCANKIDDDGDGLTDCLDPDCTGVVGCPGPVCAPDHRTGPLAVGGRPVTLQIDAKGANNDQTVPCALGGGKDQVVEVELTQVSGLRVNCVQFGDHVLGLFVSGAPRDPCDKNPLNCADLKTGTLGCDFIFPNLQPGKYYVVVEAFKPGDEGTMQLSLSAVEDHAQEICNNGKDDDGDGQVDCQDSNCSTKPICQGQTCTPDQKLGLVVKGGPVIQVATTTSGAGDSNTASCATGGGEDSVVAFTLAEQANLQAEFAQFGNHVFALYEDKGQGFACDAAPTICRPSNGSPTGKVSFGGVPAGDYFLVIESTSTGSEGSVLMKLEAR